MYKKNLEKLFSKDMTRKQFLATLGTGLLVLVGIKGLMSHLTDDSDKSNHSSSGYGGGTYGS